MEAALVKAVIDLDAIAKNVVNLKALTEKGTAFMAVVKAGGYGHGAVEVAKTALENGASWLGVARFHEAVELRNAGMTAPVLVFGYVDETCLDRVAALNITLSVYDPDMAKAVSRAAVKQGVQIRIHLKVDTGMGRVGMIIPDSSRRERQMAVLDDIQAISALPGIDLQGIYTHFAAADHADSAYTLSQLERFESLLSGLRARKIDIPVRHAANSAGIIEFPRAHFDMVRAGISLYGL